MAWDTTGTAVTSSSSYGRTIAQLEAIIADKVKLDVTDSDQLARIDEAITAVGQAACLWEGRKWWWMYGTSSFPTVADTASYALRTVNGGAMAALWSVERVYIGTDWPISPMSWSQYRDSIVLNEASSKPSRCVIIGDPPTMYLWETPDDEYTIYVDYIKRHPKIENGDSDSGLLIPDIFHLQLYVDGAVWYLRNGVGDPLGFRNCPAFVDAMRNMAEAEPERHLDLSSVNMHADVQPGSWPHNRHVIEMGDGTFIIGNPV